MIFYPIRSVDFGDLILLQLLVRCLKLLHIQFWYLSIKLNKSLLLNFPGTDKSVICNESRKSRNQQYTFSCTPFVIFLMGGLAVMLTSREI
jgi:hypothetical protein